MSLKQQIRKRVRELRRSQTDKDALSELIFSRLQSLNCYLQATTILYYIDVRDEVRTRVALEGSLKGHQRIGVPYCDGELLRCVELRSMDELHVGAYGILEPNESLRADGQRVIEPKEIDVVLVPGLAFDNDGGRLGHGKGYYDRLLEHVRPDCQKIGLGFECQMIDKVPTDPHDVCMDFVVTERGTVSISGRTVSK